MVKVEFSRTINRPVDKVFNFITDPANNARWQEGLVESRMGSSGPMRVGSQVIDVRKFLGRQIESTLEITALEPNKKFAQKVISGPLPFEVIMTFNGAGDETTIDLLAQGEPGGLFKLAEGMVQKQLQSQLEGDAERLKRALEG